MTIGVNASLRVVTQFKLGNVSKAQNVYHLSHVSIESKTDEQVVTAISAWVEALLAELTDRTSDAVELQKIECFTFQSMLWEPIGVATPVWAGTSVEDRVPSGVALQVNAFKERSGHADKKFLAGLTEVDLDGDQWQSGAIDAAEDYAAVWIAQFAGPESTLLLPVNFIPLTQQVRPYTSFSVNNIVSYQRRRKPGVGLT